MIALGHDFQASKSWLYSRSQATLDAAATHPLAQQMQVAAPEEGLRVMGAPTGDEDWCRSWLEDKMLGLSTAFEEIEKLSEHDNDNSLQAAFLLLRYSASQRIGHLLRMVPPPIIAEAIGKHDSMVVCTLSRMLDPRMDPLAPVVDGG